MAISIDYTAEGSWFSTRTDIPPRNANTFLLGVTDIAVTNGFKVLLPLSYFRKWVDWRDAGADRQLEYRKNVKLSASDVLELNALRSTITNAAIDWAGWGDYKREFLAHSKGNQNLLLLGTWTTDTLGVYEDTVKPNCDGVLKLAVKYYTKEFYAYGTFGSSLAGMEVQAALVWHGTLVPLVLEPAQSCGFINAATNTMAGTLFTPQWKEKYFAGADEVGSVSHDVQEAISLALKSLSVGSRAD